MSDIICATIHHAEYIKIRDFTTSVDEAVSKMVSHFLHVLVILGVVGNRVGTTPFIFLFNLLSVLSRFISNMH